MHSCYFSMAGIRLCLQTPQPLPIAQRLQPFLAESCMPDCTVRVQPTKTLPQPGQNALEMPPLTYEGLSKIYHRDTADGQIVAVTSLEENGDILLSYLPEYACWFSGFSGIFNRIGAELLLLRWGGLLLHASLVRHDGKGILFTGPSGIGKSTQASLWETTRGADILNGDRAALRREEDSWYAYGLPYAGSSGIYRNERVTVSALVVLSQAKENRLRKLSAMEAFGHLYAQLAVHRWNRAFVELATGLLTQLLETTDAYFLECLPEESAVRLLEGML